MSNARQLLSFEQENLFTCKNKRLKSSLRNIIYEFSQTTRRPMTRLAKLVRRTLDRK